MVAFGIAVSYLDTGIPLGLEVESPYNRSTVVFSKRESNIAWSGDTLPVGLIPDKKDISYCY